MERCILLLFLSGRAASCRRGEPLSVSTETLLYQSLFDETSYGQWRLVMAPQYLSPHQRFSDGKRGFSFPCLAPLCVSGTHSPREFPPSTLGISPRIRAPGCRRHSRHRTASVSCDPFPLFASARNPSGAGILTYVH